MEKVENPLKEDWRGVPNFKSPTLALGNSSATGTAQLDAFSKGIDDELKSLKTWLL